MGHQMKTNNLLFSVSPLSGYSSLICLQTWPHLHLPFPSPSSTSSPIWLDAAIPGQVVSHRDFLKIDTWGYSLNITPYAPLPLRPPGPMALSTGLKSLARVQREDNSQIGGVTLHTVFLQLLRLLVKGTFPTLDPYGFLGTDALGALSS